MDITKSLLDISSIDSMSGCEDEITSYLKKILKKYSNNITVTPKKSVILKLNENKAPLKIMLEAHLDCVGMVVSSITEKGFLKILNCGGIDPRVVVNSEVRVLGKKTLKGFVFKNFKNDEKEKMKIEDLMVDVNLTEKEAKELISVGDSIVYDYNPVILKNKKISTRFLDDKASIVAILLVLEKLKKQKLNCELSVVFNSQEETTKVGAKTTAYQYKPDIAIAVDVTFSRTLNCEKDYLCEMGKGSPIGVAPILDRKLGERLMEIAEKNKIPYQIEVMNEETSTNSDAIAPTRDGIKTALCSIPTKNMHTPVEVVEINDIEYTADIIYNFIISTKEVI